jgi:hypothetical protein
MARACVTPSLKRLPPDELTTKKADCFVRKTPAEKRKREDCVVGSSVSMMNPFSGHGYDLLAPNAVPP